MDGGVSDKGVLHVNTATFQYEIISKGLVANAGFAANGKLTDNRVERHRGHEMN